MLTESRLFSALESYYYKLANGEARKFPIRGSQMGDCPRKLSSLMAKRALLPFSGKVGRTFEDGHDRGIAIGKALAAALTGIDSRVELEYEVWTPIRLRHPELAQIAANRAAREFGDDCPIRVGGGNTLEVRSRCDIVAIHADGSCDLVECKGKGGWGFKKLDEEGAGEGYEVQVAFQVEGLREKGHRVASAHFLFESKDTQEWKPMAYDFTDAGRHSEWLDTAREHAASILEAYAQDGFNGDEGTPVHIPRDGGKLPWQCNYCAIGPKNGNCAPGKTIVDKRKPGAQVPAWESL